MQGEIQNAAHDVVANSDPDFEAKHPRDGRGEFAESGSLNIGQRGMLTYNLNDGEKHPWQMTRGEFLQSRIAKEWPRRKEKMVVGHLNPAGEKIYAHAYSVERALQNGKPVPNAVVKEWIHHGNEGTATHYGIDRFSRPDLFNSDLRNAAATLGIGEPLVDATEHIDAKTPIGTLLSSKQIREQWPREFRQRSQFSARVESVKLLNNFQDDLQRAIKGMRDENGALMSRARFISDNMQLAKQYGLDTGTKGITNPASIGRLGLVFDTQVGMAQGYANQQMGETDLSVTMEPCWELVRAAPVDVPRGEKLVKGELVDDSENGWPARFEAAATAANDDEALACLEATGRLVARKDSGLWAELGDGAGGYEDTLQNDFEPFAFGSQMVREGVERAECESLGFDLSDIEPPDESKFDDGEDDGEPNDDGGFNDGLEADVSDLEPLYEGLLADAGFHIVKGVAKFVASLFNRDVTDEARGPDGKWTAGAAWRSKLESSPEFKAWFGDSKVVDADGKPLVVFHGTAQDFSAFDPEKAVRGEKGIMQFSDSPSLSGNYGDKMMPVYLSLKNPMTFKQWRETPYGKEKETAIAGGFDGVADKDAGVYFAFHPAQIKSAFNRGTFSKTDPNISNSASA